MKTIGLADKMAVTSPNWLEEFESACRGVGLEYRIISVGRDCWMDDIEGLDGFVWRPVMSDASGMAEIRTKLPIIEGFNIRCFPNSLMVWLYDDKIRETFFLRANQYPTPSTFVTFEEDEAREYARQAEYPFVAKTHMGASSSGVMLIRSNHQAQELLDGIFTRVSIWEKVKAKFIYDRRLAKGDILLARRLQVHNSCPRYAYFQEFVPGDRDWRITTLGNDLVSVFVRRNRPGDFRASGSGLWERIGEKEIPVEACDLALGISNRHGFLSMTYDFRKGTKRWLINELSYTFLLNPVYSQTLFRKTSNGYQSIPPMPIGVLHLEALRDSPHVETRHLWPRIDNL